MQFAAPAIALFTEVLDGAFEEVFCAARFAGEDVAIGFGVLVDGFAELDSGGFEMDVVSSSSSLHLFSPASHSVPAGQQRSPHFCGVVVKSVEKN